MTLDERLTALAVSGDRTDRQLGEVSAHMVDLMERMSDLAAAQRVTETRMVQVLELHVQLGTIIRAHDASIDDHEDRLDKLEGNS